MSTQFVTFPAQGAAEAYEAECTVQLALMSRGAEARWYVPREDVNGKWVVALYGPPWVYGGETVAEPVSCEVLRQGMEVSDAPDWPVEEV